MKIKEVVHMKVLSKSLMFLLLAAIFILPANAALQAVGPVSPVHGFPIWYQDTTGLALQPCLGLNPDGTGLADPNCVLLADLGFDPAIPISFPNNFPVEFFYWIADADVALPGGGDAFMVLALEGAFAGETAVPGEQSVFGRVRFVMDVPETGIYTVTYPFGTKTFTVDALVPGPEIRDTEDIGCFAGPNGVPSCDPNNPPGNQNNFGLALASGIGPFLKWDPAVPPAAPAGYIGNPAIPHTVVGSPTGNNFFRVQGPTPQSSAETNLFLVAGKIFTEVAPTVSISTDRTVYTPGETVLLNLSISNPTANAYPSRLTLDIILPTGAGINLISKSFIMPSGFKAAKTIPFPIPNSTFVPSGDYRFNATLTYGSNTTSSEASFKIRRP